MSSGDDHGGGALDASERRAALRRLFVEMTERPELACQDDFEIDRLLGIDEVEGEATVDFPDLRRRHGYEQFLYGGMPYVVIHRAFQLLAPREEDVVHDLGCGYGKVLLCGALTTPASFRGIELVPQRFAGACRARDLLVLPEVEVVQGNVLDHEYGDGTIFFVCNPFSRPTLRCVIAELKRLARTRSIKIVSLSWSNRLFAEQAWLRETDSEMPAREGLPGRYGGHAGLRIYHSEDC